MLGEFKYKNLPESEEAWEKWCLLIYRAHLGSDNLTAHRRRGQTQHGIDLIGNDSTGAICGVQCKNRTRNRVLAEADVRTDIEKAKQLHIPLDRLIFATTATNDELHALAIVLTKEHKKSGLFTVTIHVWQDIEQLLNEHHEVQRRIYEEDRGREFEAISRKLDAVLISSGLRAQTDTDQVHEEIDQAFMHTEQRFPEHTVVLLERIKRRRWDRLDDRAKYRVLANLGNALAAQGKYEEAAAHYFEAADYQGETEDALALKALAHFFRKDQQSALECATAVCARFPHNGRAQAVRIQSLPDEISLEEILASLPSEVQDDPEVCAALYYRATTATRFSEAESYATKALDAAPSWIEGRINWATAIVQSLRCELDDRHGEQLPEPLRERAEKARQTLTQVIGDLKNRDSSGLLPLAVYNRATLNRLIGDVVCADRDVVEAYKLAPGDLDIALGYSNYLCRTGRHDEAILLLDRLAESVPSAKILMLLAVALWERGDQDGLKRASQVLRDNLQEVEREERSYRNDWLTLLVEVNSQLGEHEDNESIFANLQNGLVSSFMIEILRASAVLARGDAPSGIELFDEPLVHINESTPSDELRRLARLLERVGQFNKALDVYRQFVPEDRLTFDTRSTLQCAQEAKNHAYMLRVLKRLRRAGVCVRDFVEPEVALLLRYDEDQAAVQALQEFLAVHPNDPWALVNRSLIGLKISKPELVEEDADRLPQVDSVSPELGRGVVIILLKQIDRLRAIRYAYSLWRRFPDSPDANQAMIAAIFDPIGLELKLPSPDRVRPGTAVCLEDESNEQIEWVVVEDESDPPPSSTRNEFGVSHQICQAILDKRKGEQFEDVGWARKGRKGVVRDIVDKAVFRARECAAGWRRQFPHIHFIEMLKTGPADAKDAKTLLGEAYTALEQIADAQEQILSEHQKSLLPIPMLAKAVGRSVLETVTFLCSDPQHLGVRCCAGSRDELKAAFLCCSVGKPLVVEPTALATLFLLGRADLLEHIPLDLIVTQAGLDELRSLLVPEDKVDSYGGTLGLAAGQLVMHKISSTELLERNKSLQRLIGQLSASARVLGGGALASIDSELRGTISEAFDSGTAQALATAQEQKAALWTDDIRIAQFANEHFGLQCVWTHALILYLLKVDAISGKLATDISLCLHMNGYKFVGLSPDIVLRACVNSEWIPENPPSATILKSFGSSDVSQESLWPLLFESIYLIWKNAPSLAVAERITVRLLEGLGARSDARDLVEGLHASTEKLLGVNVVGAERLKEYLRSWLDGGGAGWLITPNPL